jgi:hypothetical protein
MYTYAKYKGINPIILQTVAFQNLIYVKILKNKLTPLEIQTIGDKTSLDFSSLSRNTKKIVEQIWTTLKVIENTPADYPRNITPK